MLRAAVVSILLSAIGCGGSPAAPGAAAGAASLDRIQLTTGDRFLNLSTSIPEGCSLGYSGTNVMVAARVMLTHEGQEWVVRPRAPIDGDVEMRFHDTGQPSSLGLARIDGTIRGIASDAGYRGVFLYLDGAYTGAISFPPPAGVSFSGFAFNGSLLFTTDLSGTYARSSSKVTCAVDIKLWDLSFEPGPY